MGISNPTINSTVAIPAGDQANAVVTGTLGAAGVSAPFCFYGWFNLAIWGTFTSTVTLAKSFDGGVTWIQATYPQTSVPVSLTAALAVILFEPERGVMYQLTSTGASVNYRLSATGRMAMSESF